MKHKKGFLLWGKYPLKEEIYNTIREKERERERERERENGEKRIGEGLRVRGSARRKIFSLNTKFSLIICKHKNCFENWFMKIRQSLIISLKLNYEIIRCMNVTLHFHDFRKMFDFIRINIKTASYLYVIGTKIVTYFIISGIN